MPVKKKKILIVIENTLFRDALRYFFRLLKLSVRIVSSSQKRFEVRRSQPDLIILDAHRGIKRLPKTIEMIRRRYSDLKVICLASRHKGSRIQKMISRKDVHVSVADLDLGRIHALVTRLRYGSKLKNKSLGEKEGLNDEKKAFI